MKILIVGAGGREHAILKQVSDSKHVDKIYCAPGNAGMLDLAECVAIAVDDVAGLLTFAKTENIDLTIVGPELPLTLGVVDAFQKENLKIFGPTQKASLLEGSKIFTKEFCVRHNIPTAGFVCFENLAEAQSFIKERRDYPVVIKADGLAAGKGVIIAKNEAEALQALDAIMVTAQFGAGQKVLIEDFIAGEEASFIVVADGQNFIEFSSSQDHKRAFDNDKGPNTGGMGAYAPAPIVTEELRQKVIERIINPTIKGMAAEGRTYTGFLYAGLMMDAQGEPLLLEYNCRLGDPEAEVLLPLLKSDFIEFLQKAIEGTLPEYKAEFVKGSAVCVVLASEGYPGSYPKGVVIDGLDADLGSDVFVYHAGTQKKDGHFVTSGGRVLTVTALGSNLPTAIQKVYQSVSKIHWHGVHYRKDIGQKGLARG